MKSNNHQNNNDSLNGTFKIKCLCQLDIYNILILETNKTTSSKNIFLIFYKDSDAYKKLKRRNFIEVKEKVLVNDSNFLIHGPIMNNKVFKVFNDNLIIGVKENNIGDIFFVTNSNLGEFYIRKKCSSKIAELFFY